MIKIDSLLALLNIPEEDIKLFSLRQSNKAKRLLFKPSIRYGFEIVLPKIYNDNWVLDSVKKTKTKIKQRLAEIKEARKELKPTLITLRSTGDSWQVIYGNINDFDSEAITETSTTLSVPEKPEDVFWAAFLLQKWLQRKALEYLPKRLNDLSIKLKLSYNRVSIKQQKTRWGSCSINRNINLNRNLMLMPPEVVDYVLHHELVHLKVLNHSATFWQELGSLFPQYKKELKRLKTHRIPEWALV